MGTTDVADTNADGANKDSADVGVSAPQPWKTTPGLARILRVVAAIDPALDAEADAVRAVVGQVVAARTARPRVARELEARPGLLPSDRSGGCTATYRLVDAWAATGSAPVRAPHGTLCRGCGHRRRAAVRGPDGTMLCAACCSPATSGRQRWPTGSICCCLGT
ncbi:MAG: hypothetical protein ACRYG2_24605 [Janthinobacterium lividum]